MGSVVERSSRGRPAATTHGDIERAAFRLFDERGFAGTTLDDIARAVGVGRRTLFRYYPSKNDIPWGQFPETLERFARVLRETPPDASLYEAVHHGVVEFNRFPPEVADDHRRRMRLILNTPELQAHSVLQYAAWRDVISTYVAERLSVDRRAPMPQVVAHASLGVALTAYDAWLAQGGELVGLLDVTMSELRQYLMPDDLSRIRRREPSTPDGRPEPS